MDENNFGNKIAALRKAKGYTQAYVAKALGVTPAAVSKWENSTAKPRVEMLFRLAELLEVNAEELMAQSVSEEKQTTEQETAPRKIPTLKIAVIALALVVLILGSFLTVDALNRIKVPNVVGMEISQATEVLEKLGLSVTRVDVYSNDEEKKTVILQSVGEGDRVRPGTAITVTVSKGRQPFAVPNVVEKTLEEARSLFEGTNFKVIIREEYSSFVKAGRVIRQSLTAGSVFDREAEIILTVSLGRDFMPVPNLVGKTLDEAKSLLEGSGINLDSNIKCNNTVEEGVIISQGIEAGEMLDRGSWLSVTVSAGKGYDGKDTNGNSANNHFVIKQGDWIYYIDEKSDKAIYKMRPDKSEKQLVVEGNIPSFCVRDEWIYYSNIDTNNNATGIFKVKLDGSKKTKLTSAQSRRIFIKDEWVYYLEQTSTLVWTNLRRVRTDGTQDQLVCNDRILCATAIDDKIYCILYKDRSLYSMGSDGGNMAVVHPDFSASEMVYSDGIIYSVCEDGRIQAVNLDGSSYKIIDIEGDVETLSVVDGYIYAYSSVDSAQGGGMVFTKSKVSTPTNTTELMHGARTSREVYVNVVDGWLYYPEYQYGGVMYRVKTDGSRDFERVFK